jgi:hypothetical protein
MLIVLCFCFCFFLGGVEYGGLKIGPHAC